MIENPDYCMNSFLMYRMIVSENQCFSKKYKPNLADISFDRFPVYNSIDLYNGLKQIMSKTTEKEDAALALSGGIDSAILASMMPKGSTAYTFRCVVPGTKVLDESGYASKIAKKFQLEHKIIDIYWEDVVSSIDLLMKTKGAPFHSIESQIYKACLQAKDDGFNAMIFGENADIIYGGMDGLLKKEWTIGEYIERYSYVLPYKVLRNPRLILDPFIKHEHDGFVDSYSFTNEYFRKEALGTYNNACSSAKIRFVGPFSETKLMTPIDLNRIRCGDTKYLVREVFKRIFGDCSMPPKIPMPRATSEWMSNWKGPENRAFYPNSTRDLSGDQKWMVYCLETFLQLIDY